MNAYLLILRTTNFWTAACVHILLFNQQNIINSVSTDPKEIKTFETINNITFSKITQSFGFHSMSPNLRYALQSVWHHNHTVKNHRGRANGQLDGTRWNSCENIKANTPGQTLEPYLCTRLRQKQASSLINQLPSEFINHKSAIVLKTWH